MRIDIEQVKKMIAERKYLNSLPFREIEWYENDKKLEFEKDFLDDWEFTGLNNIDFISTHAYLDDKI